MMKIQKRLMTDSSRCSRRLSSVLVAVLLASLPLRVTAQRQAWTLPESMETVKVNSFAVGRSQARDTYLSGSTYSGFAFGWENDGWAGYEPHRFFRQGRLHSDLYFSYMENPLGGGLTLEFSGRTYEGFMWHAVKNSKCDFLAGPPVMLELGVLYNQQNSNNPVNMEGYFGGGVCADNTFRFSLFRYDMALQATFFAPLAGFSMAPDYDQPYYYMLAYNGGLGKALHFIHPFNNLAFTQQVALVLPIKDKRLRVGFTCDGLKNNLGGHSRFLLNTMATVGFAMRYQTKKWDR